MKNPPKRVLVGSITRSFLPCLCLKRLENIRCRLRLLGLLDLRSSPTGLSIFLLLSLSKPFRPIISIPKSGSTDSVTVSLGTQTHIRLWWTCRHTIAGSRILFCLLHTVLTCSIYLVDLFVNLWCCYSQILDGIILCSFDTSRSCQ